MYIYVYIYIDIYVYTIYIRIYTQKRIIKNLVDEKRRLEKYMINPQKVGNEEQRNGTNRKEEQHGKISCGYFSNYLKCKYRTLRLKESSSQTKQKASRRKRTLFTVSTP